MSNLIDYAKDELKRIGMIDSGEPYNDLITKVILDLIELFDSQDHSGFSAPYVINTFNRLAMFKPLSPLTGEADEWNDIGHGLFQNKRYSAVFKDQDGAYNSEGKVFTDDGETWYTCKESRVNVTFPYVVPDKPEYVYNNKEEIEMTELEAELISDFDAREFVEHYYEPVEDKPGYVWLSKRNMQIISIDVLVEALECSSFGRCLRKNVAESEEDV